MTDCVQHNTRLQNVVWWWETSCGWTAASWCRSLGRDDSMYFSLLAFISCTKNNNVILQIESLPQEWWLISANVKKNKNLQDLIVWSLGNIRVPWLGHELPLLPMRLDLQHNDGGKKASEKDVGFSLQGSGQCPKTHFQFKYPGALGSTLKIYKRCW